jgi:hypothetical protein
MFLTYDCMARGIASNGSRQRRLARLQAHDQEASVVVPAMQQVITGGPPTETVVARQQGTMDGRGDMQLLGLPHDIIRVIFCNLAEFELFELLHVCRYLYSDARAVLCAKAQAEWGPGGSPMAWSLWFYFCNNFTSRMRRDFLKSIGVDIRESATNHMCIENCITKYGSIDALALDYRRRKALAAATAIEQERVTIAIGKRHAECNELLQQLGYSPIHRLDARRVTPSIFGQLFCGTIATLSGIVPHLRKYIYSGNPAQLELARAELTAPQNTIAIGLAYRCQLIISSSFVKLPEDGRFHEMLRLFCALENNQLFGTYSITQFVQSMRDAYWTSCRFLVCRQNKMTWHYTSGSTLGGIRALLRNTYAVTACDIYTSRGEVERINLGAMDREQEILTYLLEYGYFGYILVRI